MSIIIHSSSSTKVSTLENTSSKNINTCPLCHQPFPNNHNYHQPSPPINNKHHIQHQISSNNQTINCIQQPPATPPPPTSTTNQGYYDTYFIEQQKLGRGQRGSVFKCTHIINSTSLGSFAVKAIPVGTSQVWLMNILKEVKLLEKLRHPNIIEYKHAWIEDRQLSLFAPKVPCLFILMQLANGGNLEEYLHVQWDPCLDPEYVKQQFRQKRNSSDRHSRKNTRSHHTTSLQYPSSSLPMNIPPSHTLTLSENLPFDSSNYARNYGGIGIGSNNRKVRYLTQDEIWTFFSDICNGLKHLHNLGVIHRDLKPPNLLLNFDDDNLFPRILITDFGECEVVSEEKKLQRTGATGTLEFMPPELLKKDKDGNLIFDHSLKCDIWSLGVILYFLSYSHVPYTQIDDVDELKIEILQLKTINFPTDARVGKDIKELIIQLMDINPENRPNINEIVNRVTSIKNINSTKTYKNHHDTTTNSIIANTPTSRSYLITLVAVISAIILTISIWYSF